MKRWIAMAYRLAQGRAQLLMQIDPARPMAYRTLPRRLWLRHSAYLLSRQGRG